MQESRMGKCSGKLDLNRRAHQQMLYAKRSRGTRGDSQRAKPTAAAMSARDNSNISKREAHQTQSKTTCEAAG